MLKKIAVLASLAAAATSFAADTSNVSKSFNLKDGSTVYIFKDGTMAMENKLGRTVGMKAGHVMETQDGQKIIMIGNEISRLETIKSEHRGGN